MAIKRWNEFEISDFRGIASSNRHPQKNECQECENFDLRYVFGDLTVRYGYNEIYSEPQLIDHRSKLSNITYLSFENMFVSEGIGDDGISAGQEIIVRVGKGTLAAETPITYSQPDSINIPLIFVSHKFNGSYWEALSPAPVGQETTLGVFWLNRTILTKIGSSGVASSPNENQITLDCASTGLVSDATKLDNFTVINLSQSPYQTAKVIYSDNNGGALRLHLSARYHGWSSGDTIIIMKHYIPYDSLLAMYNTTADQISFHKILEDLRIGFGSDDKKIGLSVGYRKSYLRLQSIEFGSYSGYLEAFSTTNGLVLDIYNGLEQDIRLDIDAVTSGSIAPPTDYHYFIAVGLLDDYERIYLNEAKITWDTGNMNLQVNTNIKLGQENNRLTDIELYYSADGKLYYYLNTIPIRDKEYNASHYKLNTLGYLTPVTNFTNLLAAGTKDAVRPSDDADTIGDWKVADLDELVSLASVASSPAPQDPGYSLKISHTHTSAAIVGAFYPLTFLKGRLDTPEKITFKFYVYISALMSIIVNWETKNGVSYFAFQIDRSVLTTSGWTLIEKEVYTPGDISLTDIIGFTVKAKFSSSEYFAIDNFQVTKLSKTYNISSTTISSANNEMFDKIGFDIKQPMVRSWDDAIVTRGRTFLVNPYLEKKYANKIFSSHISGAGSYQYDVITGENYIDLENFDGNNLVGIEVLPNMNFIAFRRNSSQQVDPDTGATKEIIYGNGVVSRRSIVNFGDKVVWCGDNDIMLTDGLNTINLTDGTIREEYRALTTKTGIMAIREERDNAYRFFTGDTTAKTEYILTKKGWVKRINGSASYPEDFVAARDGTVLFMNGGKIFSDEKDYTDDGDSIGPLIWKSIDIDAELLGEGMTERDFFNVRSMWMDYTVHTVDLGQIQVSYTINKDGAVFTTNTFLAGSAGRYKKFIQLPIGCTGRRISLKIKLDPNPQGTNYVISRSLSVHSFGFMWKPIKSGRFN